MAKAIDEMLASPERAEAAIYSVSDATCIRLGFATAQAYAARNFGATMDMVSENDADKAYLLAFQGPPAMLPQHGQELPVNRFILLP